MVLIDFAGRQEQEKSAGSRICSVLPAIKDSDNRISDEAWRLVQI